MTLRHDVLVHGDFHHHNILTSARGHLAIDPQPFLGEPEYDVVALPLEPAPDRAAGRRCSARGSPRSSRPGLDEERIRAWTVIRGSFLLPEEAGGATARSSRNGCSCSQRCSIVVVRAGWSGS